MPTVIAEAVFLQAIDLLDAPSGTIPDFTPPPNDYFLTPAPAAFRIGTAQAFTIHAPPATLVDIVVNRIGDPILDAALRERDLQQRTGVKTIPNRGDTEVIHIEGYAVGTGRIEIGPHNWVGNNLPATLYTITPNLSLIHI